MQVCVSWSFETTGGAVVICNGELRETADGYERGRAPQVLENLLPIWLELEVQVVDPHAALLNCQEGVRKQQHTLKWLQWEQRSISGPRIRQIQGGCSIRVAAIALHRGLHIFGG